MYYLCILFSYPVTLLAWFLVLHLLVGQELLVGTSLSFVGTVVVLHNLLVVAYHNLLVEGTGELWLSEHFLATQGVDFHHITSMNGFALGGPCKTPCVSSMLHVHC